MTKNEFRSSTNPGPMDEIEISGSLSHSTIGNYTIGVIGSQPPADKSQYPPTTAYPRFLPISPTRCVMNHFSPMSSLFGPCSDLVRVGSRRWFLQTGMAGVAGLSLPRAPSSAGANEVSREAHQQKISHLVLALWRSQPHRHVGSQA